MGIFDIIQGVSSSVNQFTGAMGSNQLVPPLEVDSAGIVGDGFEWLRGTGEIGGFAANLLQNTYTPVAIRRALTGLPYGGQRPVSNISTQFKIASRTEKDWRVRLIVPIENPLFSSLGSGPMAILKNTAGVIFPYTPQIETSSIAEYDDMSLTHSNYPIPAYNKSRPDNINITADFSANDAKEASYCLATIHFFRTVTKMFFGNDGADNGRPPPILILRGYGSYMFPDVPVVCKSASLTLPKDVDYVPAYTMANGAVLSTANNSGISTEELGNRVKAAMERVFPFGAKAGGKGAGAEDLTYVPTQFSMNIQLQTTRSRTELAERFSLKKFATGTLTRDGGFI